MERLAPMDAHLLNLLTELETWGRQNDEHQQERGKKMLNLDRDSARLISLLIRSSRRTRLLEIGTSNGYSTIWLAWAAGTAGGRVISIDRSAEKHALADANLKRAGLRDLVDLRLGDATDVLATLPGPFDFVFLDAGRLSYPAQLSSLMPKLTPDVIVLADNALSHPEEMVGYFGALAALPEFDHLVVPVGKGLSVAYRQAPSRL